MKGFLLVACCAAILINVNACRKYYDPGYASCSPVPVEHDSTTLLQFAADHKIMPTKDPSGLYYEIIDSGYGPRPGPTSTVYVAFVGKLMDGTTFDSVGNWTNTGWNLNTLLDGWQIGLSKIYSGGRIKLLLPSALAYKCTGNGTTVPGDAPVYYSIALVSFHN